MPGTAIITAPIGAAVSAAALVFTNVRYVMFDTVRANVDITLADGTVKSFDTKATSTVTATASSGVFTFTIQQ